MTEASKLCTQLTRQSAEFCSLIGDEQFARVSHFVKVLHEVIYDIEAAYVTSQKINVAMDPFAVDRIVSVNTLIEDHVTPKLGKVGNAYRQARAVLDPHIAGQVGAHG